MPTPIHKDAFLNLARQEDKRWQSSWNAMSGADQAEGELYKLTRDFYRAMADGKDMEATIKALDAEWRIYANKNNDNINAAGKIRRGPMQGQSSRHYRFTSPDLFQSKAIHLRQMTRITLGESKMNDAQRLLKTLNEADIRPAGATATKPGSDPAFVGDSLMDLRKHLLRCSGARESLTGKMKLDNEAEIVRVTKEIKHRTGDLRESTLNEATPARGGAGTMGTWHIVFQSDNRVVCGVYGAALRDKATEFAQELRAKGKSASVVTFKGPRPNAGEFIGVVVAQGELVKESKTLNEAPTRQSVRDFEVVSLDGQKSLTLIINGQMYGMSTDVAAALMSDLKSGIARANGR